MHERLGFFEHAPEPTGRHTHDQQLGVPGGLLEVGGGPQPLGQREAG